MMKKVIKKCFGPLVIGKLQSCQLYLLFFALLDTSVCCSDQLFTLGGGVYLRSTLHLHRVTSLWEVLVTEPGAVRTQV